MRLKTTVIALAVVVGLGAYYAARDDAAEENEQQRTAQAPKAPLPSAFKSESAAGGTPGDDVRRYIENVGTAGAAFDAWQLLMTCVRAERNQLDDAAQKCAGITPGQRARMGELLSTAMVHNVPGAAAAFARELMGAPADQLAQRRRENPGFDEAVKTIVKHLHEAAPHDREAIAILSSLYRTTNPITGERDAEKALVYSTAFDELNRAPYMEQARALLVTELSKGLTREQVERARAAGLKLARECDCRG